MKVIIEENLLSILLTIYMKRGNAKGLLGVLGTTLQMKGNTLLDI